jgi:hypothetical protein
LQKDGSTVAARRAFARAQPINPGDQQQYVHAAELHDLPAELKTFLLHILLHAV